MGERLRDRSWLTAAELPVGWVRVGIEPKPGSMTSEMCWSPNKPAMQMQKWHTQQHNSGCGLRLTPWNCPLPTLPIPFYVNTCEICGAVEYFGDIGLLWNMTSGDSNWQVFFLKHSHRVQFICVQMICTDVQFRIAKRHFAVSKYLTKKSLFKGLWLFQL